MEVAKSPYIADTSPTPGREGFPRFIAVEGPVGVGKTTLAKRLAATFDYDVLLEESPQDKPFISRFYHRPKQIMLATQLHFLFHRASQLQSIRQNDLFRSVRVSDFCMEKDLLFAEMHLAADELKLYNRAYKMQIKNLPAPDLVIYLQAPVYILKERIRKRGDKKEKLIGHDYLERLSDAYAELFHYYDQSPLLIVNTEEIDFVHNEQDYRQLVEEIMSCRKGRYYLNAKSFKP